MARCQKIPSDRGLEPRQLLESEGDVCLQAVSVRRLVILFDTHMYPEWSRYGYRDTHTYIYAYIQLHTITYTYTQTYMHAWMHACIHVYNIYIYWHCYWCDVLCLMTYNKFRKVGCNRRWGRKWSRRTALFCKVLRWQPIFQLAPSESTLEVWKKHRKVSTYGVFGAHGNLR